MINTSPKDNLQALVKRESVVRETRGLVTKGLLALAFINTVQYGVALYNQHVFHKEMREVLSSMRAVNFYTQSLYDHNVLLACNSQYKQARGEPCEK